MKTINEILNQFKTDLSTDLPALLVAAGVDDFDDYIIGGSRDPESKALCIYVDNFDKDSERNNLNMIFQAQLYQVNFEDSSKYAQVISDYLVTYDPAEIEMNVLMSLNCDIYPIEANSTTFIFFDVSFTEMLDSCN